MFIKWLKKIFKNNQRNNTNNTNNTNNSIKRKKEGEEQTEFETINARLTKLESDLEKAVAGYRLMLITNNPGILPEMISGRNIDELDGSLKMARELTEKIKARLEQKTIAERIPSGAPVRTPPDTSNLSSHEKIVYGLEQK